MSKPLVDADAKQMSMGRAICAGLAVLCGLVLPAANAPAMAAMPGSTVRSATATTEPLAASSTREQRLASLVNAERSKRGLKTYAVSKALSAVAEAQARAMADQQRLFHNPTLTSDVKRWRAIGENVAYTSTVKRAHTLLMNSPTHRSNLLSNTFTQIGLGVVKDSYGTVWVVQVFRTPA